MSDTMISMELLHADNLTADQIMIGDLIKIDNDIVEVIFIESDSTGDNYDVQIVNDFGEKEIVQFAFDDAIDWYVPIQ